MIREALLCDDCGRLGPTQPTTEPRGQLDALALELGWTLGRTPGQWSKRVDLCGICTELRAMKARAKENT